MRFQNQNNAVRRVVDQIDVSERPLAIMAIGVRGSGKSQFIDEVRSKAKIRDLAISPDLLRNKLSPSIGATGLNQLIGNEMDELIRHGINKDGVTILDDMHLRMGERRSRAFHFRELGALTVGGIYVDMDLDEVMGRISPASTPTASYIGQSFQTLTANPPSLDDGFDWLMTIDNEGVRIDQRATT